MYDLLLVGFLGRLELLGNFLPHPSASNLNPHSSSTAAASRMLRLSSARRVLVSLSPACDFNLNQTRSLLVHMYLLTKHTCLFHSVTI